MVIPHKRDVLIISGIHIYENSLCGQCLRARLSCDSSYVITVDLRRVHRASHPNTERITKQGNDSPYTYHDKEAENTPYDKLLPFFLTFRITRIGNKLDDPEEEHE